MKAWPSPEDDTGLAYEATKLEQLIYRRASRRPAAQTEDAATTSEANGDELAVMTSS